MPYVRKTFDEMASEFGGAMKLVRKEMGISSFGVQAIEVPPNLEGPEHDESSTGQEELYVGLSGSGWLEVDGERVELAPRVAISIPAGTPRHIIAGPEGVGFIAVGGVPGQAYDPPSFTA